MLKSLNHVHYRISPCRHYLSNFFELVQLDFCLVLLFRRQQKRVHWTFVSFLFSRDNIKRSTGPFASFLFLGDNIKRSTGPFASFLFSGDNIKRSTGPFYLFPTLIRLIARCKATCARRTWSALCCACASSSSRSARALARFARSMSISRFRSAESAMIVI